MKRKLYNTLVGLMLAVALYSQDVFKPELAVGASFGTNFSSIRFSPKVQQGMLMGYSGGFTVRYNSEKNVGLQAEINFIQQGWKEQFDENPEFAYSHSINYVELPFMTHIYFGGSKAKFFLNLGPKIGYALGDKIDSNLGDATLTTISEQHDMAIENKFDWGLCGGPGLEIRTGIGYFLLEGRYYYALSNIFGSNKEDYFAQSSGQVLSVKLTYLLPLFK